MPMHHLNCSVDDNTVVELRYFTVILKKTRCRRCRDRMVVDLQLPMQSVTITTKVVSSNPVHNEVFSIRHGYPGLLHQ